MQRVDNLLLDMERTLYLRAESGLKGRRGEIFTMENLPYQMEYHFNPRRTTEPI